MKKAILLLSLFLAAFVSSTAQETVTLTFTANTQEGMYCSFDAVNVTNVTRGWTETLAYPDTILVLSFVDGIGEQNGMAFRLGEAYPNPFTDETNVSVEMPVAGDALVQVVRVDGTIVATSQNHLEAGLHCVKVRLSAPSMAFLTVTTAQGRQVARIVSEGNGGHDAIVVETLSVEHTPTNQPMRSDATGEFQLGDMMRYTAMLFDGPNIIYSNTITQQQFESQNETLYFDLTLPEVITNEVTDITQTTAIGGGEVIATGGISVIERGICWSTSHNPTTSDNHASSGAGIGIYSLQMGDLLTDTTYYVRAYATNVVGTVYGSEVSFMTQLAYPVGAINGLFSVSETQQVYFSQGNLQYIGSASVPYWKFADNQWDYLGTTTGQNSNNENVDRDLFGWGTSGYNHGANCYQPWSTSTNYLDYYAYGSESSALYNMNGQADWGYNAIINGGNSINTWRTMYWHEWLHVFNLRTTTTGIRYAKAQVNNINGVILLPDDWNSTVYCLNYTNASEVPYTTNVINIDQWSVLENSGAVFLPVSGLRDGTMIGDLERGYYWSATPIGPYNVYYCAYLLLFDDTSVTPDSYTTRSRGCAVRLVQDYQP